MRATPLSAVVLAAAVASGGCGTSTSAPRADDGGGLARFYDQDVRWRPCPKSDVPRKAAAASLRFQCARVEVPLDYADPEGRTIELALNRIPAADDDRRVGALLTNPGGPGGSGLELVYEGDRIFTERLRRRYDIVGMDPRGVGKSDPVRCQTPEQMARTEKKTDDAVQAARTFVAACEKKSGTLLPHTGTDDVARDLDVVRAALSEDKLNYLGFSYGTVLGQFYAEQFPERTGRMVLDSVANPSTWPGDPSAQAIGLETALTVFVESCTDRRKCRLGSDTAAVLKKIDDLATRLESKPLPAGKDSPPVDSDALLQVLAGAMYKEETWPGLADALAAALKGNGRPLGAIVAEAGGGDDGDSDATGSFPAVACLHLRPDQRTPEAAKEAVEEATTDAPVFGPYVADQWQLCAQWPVPSLPQAGRALAAEGAPTILLMHNLYDAATPVQWARGVDGQLSRSVLVTNAAGGHGVYMKGPCTKKTVDSFLISGKVPARGTTCHDRAPGIPTGPPPAR